MRWLIVLLVAILVGGRACAEAVIDWLWWREMGHEGVWARLLLYEWGPVLAAGALAAVVAWVALARGLKSAESGLSKLPGRLARGVSIGVIVLGFLMASATVNSWTVMRWAGGSGTGGWTDPVFGNPLGFYLFDIPFWRMLLAYVIGLCLLSGGVYWFAARGGDMENLFRSGRRAAAESTFIPKCCSDRCSCAALACSCCWRRRCVCS
ncbi:MAG: UPF0182 family protein [Bryobacteraceae bacterium]